MHILESVAKKRMRELKTMPQWFEDCSEWTGNNGV